MNHWLWPESNHATITMPCLPTTILLFLHFDQSGSNQHVLSRVVRRQTVCHANPDMQPTWLLALPTGREREQRGGGEEENMEGGAELGDWMRVCGGRGLQGWRRRGGERRLNWEGGWGKRRKGGWMGKERNCGSKQREWEFWTEGGSGCGILPLELRTTHTIRQAVNEPTVRVSTLS